MCEKCTGEPIPHFPNAQTKNPKLKLIFLNRNSQEQIYSKKDLMVCLKNEESLKLSEKSFVV